MSLLIPVSYSEQFAGDKRKLITCAPVLEVYTVCMYDEHSVSEMGVELLYTTHLSLQLIRHWGMIMHASCVIRGEFPYEPVYLSPTEPPHGREGVPDNKKE